MLIPKPAITEKAPHHVAFIEGRKVGFLLIGGIVMGFAVFALTQLAEWTRLTCDRQSGVCEYIQGNLFDSKTVSMPLDEVQRAAVVIRNNQDAPPRMHLELRTRDEAHPLIVDAFAFEPEKYDEAAQRINAYLDSAERRLDYWGVRGRPLIFTEVALALIAFVFFVLGSHRKTGRLDRETGLVVEHFGLMNRKVMRYPLDEIIDIRDHHETESNSVQLHLTGNRRVTLFDRTSEGLAEILRSYLPERRETALR